MKPNVQRIGRDGRTEKNLIDAPIKPGMQRQTKGDLHPYLHGTALQDEPNAPLKSYEKPIVVHPSMTPKQGAAHAASPSANDVLLSAASLGKRTQKA